MSMLQFEPTKKKKCNTLLLDDLFGTALYVLNPNLIKSHDAVRHKHVIFGLQEEIAMNFKILLS